MNNNDGLQTKQVIFTLNGEEFGFDIMVVNAIEKYTNLIHVPNAPSYICGIMNLRGDVIPIYSLRKKFNLQEKSADEETKLIITKTNNMFVGFEVDAVKEIIEIPASSISNTPAIIKSYDTSYIQNIANINGRMILLLNHNGMISSKEQEKIESLITT